MADLAAIAFVLILVCSVIYFGFQFRNRQLQEKASQLWMLEEHPDGSGNMVVYAVHPGDPSQIVGKVSWVDPDYESKIEEVRCQGDIRIAAQNSRLQLNKGH